MDKHNIGDIVEVTVTGMIDKISEHGYLINTHGEKLPVGFTQVKTTEQEELIKKILLTFAETDITSMDSSEERYCQWCGNERETGGIGYYDDDAAIDSWHHEDDCLVLQARQLVKSLYK